jgi:hypothetical protein
MLEPIDVELLPNLPIDLKLLAGAPRLDLLRLAFRCQFPCDRVSPLVELVGCPAEQAEPVIEE